MPILPNLAQEFEHVCAQYSAVDQQGKDLVSLVRIFIEEYDDFDLDVETDVLLLAWGNFLDEHNHQMTVPILGLTIYTLVTYWDKGQRLLDSLPILERMVLRDTVQDISDEIHRRSEVSGNAE